LFGGVGVATAIIVGRSARGRAEGPSDAAMVATRADAAVAAPPDASRVVVEIPLDAGADEVADAALETSGRADPGAPAGTRRRPDAGAGSLPRTATIQVITKPDEGVLYIDNSYRGPSGVTMEQPFGSRARIKCTHPGYEPGFVDVTFDGKTEVVLCHMARIK